MFLVTFPQVFLRLFSLVFSWVSSAECITYQLQQSADGLVCPASVVSLGTRSPATVALPKTH